MKDTLLLCTFCKEHLLEKKIEEIKTKFTILQNKIYVMKLAGRLDCFILTYNVNNHEGFNYKDLISNTINLHRKKETNTLYTINALNELIKTINNGALDKNYKIEWNDYFNTLMLLKEDKVVMSKTVLQNILTW